MKAQFNFNRLTYLFLLLLALFSVAGFAQNRPNEQTRKLSEAYPVASGDKLFLSNKFGEIKVSTWAKNEVSVEVGISTWSNNASAAQRRVQEISISHSKSGNLVKFQTNFSQDGGRFNGGMEINYTVNMPASLALEIDHKFGSVYLGALNGPINLNLEFGHLSAGKLAGNAQISVKHGSGTVEEIATGAVSTAFCKFMDVKKVGKADFDDKHGKLAIESGQELTVKSAYSGFEIGHVEKSIAVTSSYGSMTIGSVAPGFKFIQAKSAYGSCNINLMEAPNFDFSVNVAYGSFKNSLSNVKIHTSIEKNTSAEYGGARGSGGGTVQITSSYGSVKFQ